MEEEKLLYWKTLKIYQKRVIIRLLNQCTILYFVNNLTSKLRTEISLTLFSIVHLNNYKLVAHTLLSQLNYKFLLETMLLLL